MKAKVALITGITGQDGSYLAELLLGKDYEVHGLVRRTSTTNTQRIDHLLNDEMIFGQKLFLHYADLTDAMNVFRMINEIRPDEVYNLAAQSHVAVSFEEPIYTANADALGALRLLEAIRVASLTDKTRFYQASTSEMFGKVHESPQTESTIFHPRSPYGVAKLYAHWMTVNYRESYGMFACSGILFNHESPRRGETFVTRKITLGLSRVFLGKQGVLLLGNLDAKRDWGHAKDFVEMQWRMLQQDKPTDYVIATGVQYTVRDFVNSAAAHVGVEVEWQGSGSDEYAVIAAVENEQITSKPGDILIKVSREFYRPAEVSTLLGDSSKAKAELGWQPGTGFEQLVSEMMAADFNRISCE